MLSKTKKFAFVALPLLLGAASLALAAPSDQQGPSGDSRGGPRGDHMGDHRGDHHWDPAVFHKMACTERYAFRVGRMAFVEAELDLTEQQRPLFAKWRQALLDGATKDKALCLEDVPKPDSRPNLVDREGRMEKNLALKLQVLQASRPALQALYESLTPAQRAVLDRPHHGGGARHGGWKHGGGDGPRGERG